MRALSLIAVSLLTTACVSIPIDTSEAAVTAGDKTLILSALPDTYKQGFDVLRVVRDSDIAEVLTLPMPYAKQIVAGELRVRYKGTVTSVSIDKPVIEIPWKTITGHKQWQANDAGPAQITGTIKYKDAKGEHYVDMLGYAFVVVLNPGYVPLPVDSGMNAFQTECKFSWSSAGRSSLKCKGYAGAQ